MRPSLADTLERILSKSLYSYGQLAQLSGVPKRTIANWIDGTVQRPHQWHGLALLADALNLDAQTFSLLLTAAGFPPLESLLPTITRLDEQKLLARWSHSNGEKVKTSAALTWQQRNLLSTYCRNVSQELAQLPAYFPRKQRFAFLDFYQEACILPLNEVAPDNPDGVAWSEVQHDYRRAVILGEPGAGKTWLLRREAIRLAQPSLDGYEDAAKAELPFFVRLADLTEFLNRLHTLHEIFEVIARLCARQFGALADEQLLFEALYVFLVRHSDRAVLLLDGLDEIPDRGLLRATARYALERLAKQSSTRILLTARKIGYHEPVFPLRHDAHEFEAELLPLSERQTIVAMRRWFGNERIELSTRVQELVRASTRFSEEVKNPLLLSLVCTVIDQQVDIKEGHKEGRIAETWLYEQVLLLLLEGRWRSHELRQPLARVRHKLTLLERVAWCFATHAQKSWVTLPHNVLEESIQGVEAKQLESSWRREWGESYVGVLAELNEWDGILVTMQLSLAADNGITYRFLHRSLQEYLVARYLARRLEKNDDTFQIASSHLMDAEWYPILRLLTELSDRFPVEIQEKILATMLAQEGGDTLPTSSYAALLGAEMMLKVPALSSLQSEYNTVVASLVKILRNEQVHSSERIRAGRLLAALGDPRREVIDVDAIDFVTIPAGPFLMGSNRGQDTDAREDDFPFHTRELPEFRISRYPITNAQFATFVAETQDLYQDARHWPEAIALGHWQAGKIMRLVPEIKPNGEYAWPTVWTDSPYSFGPPFDLANHPANGFNWYEAKAFVRWLNERWRRSGRLADNEMLDLPSEAEWEKAARGPHGRIYPWGNTFDGSRCCWIRTLLHGPCAVGAFPNGASVYGVEDMIGNQWEWTRSVFVDGAAYMDYAQATGDFPEFAGEFVKPASRIVLRGAAYYSFKKEFMRCASRSSYFPYGRTDSTFRVVLRPVTQG